MKAFDVRQFRLELRDLLLKHDVGIGVDIDDTQGVNVDFIVYTVYGQLGIPYTLKAGAQYLEGEDL